MAEVARSTGMNKNKKLAVTDYNKHKIGADKPDQLQTY
jgi:hypothetical protein